MIIFLSISLNMCFRCSKEPSHRDGSFEYPQHMFWFRNKKNNFQLRTFIWGPGFYRLPADQLNTCFVNFILSVNQLKYQYQQRTNSRDQDRLLCEQSVLLLNCFFRIPILLTNKLRHHRILKKDPMLAHKLKHGHIKI